MVGEDQTRRQRNAGHVTGQAIIAILLVQMAHEAAGTVPCGILPHSGVRIVTVEAGDIA